ncbi:uncharacterized protein LOC132176211 [Corylus avellana]|uniref:uncharacterized protein LOC132176211 n=1 Tax=Corylus avellana TaxID=13451 RepID=UPI00286AED20|nr:uncharacterized protein LOC132176211 [Corylus avellana]
MGVWDYICSTGDSLKRNTPDLTAVKGWCSSSYGSGLAAVTMIDNVRIKATQTLSQHMSDEETMSKFRLVAADLAKNAAVYGCQEGLKIIPGGTLVYETVSRSIRGEKKFERNCEVEMKALQARVAKLEEEVIKKKSEGDLERADQKHHQPCADLKSNAYKKPEDVIRAFMKKEFIFLDDLMVPEVGRTRKNPK